MPEPLVIPEKVTSTPCICTVRSATFGTKSVVKIADEHEDAKTQIQVKADITNLGNSVPLQNYANINELQAAIMTLGNADDLMVTFLNAENTNIVKLFSREMNAAASVFKARHNIDNISAGNSIID